MTVTARRATSLGESESSLVEDDDDDDDEFVIVRTHAHIHTHAATHNVFTGGVGGGRLLAGQAGRQIGRWMLDPWTIDEGRSLKQLARSWRY